MKTRSVLSIIAGLCIAILFCAVVSFSQTVGTGAIVGRAQDSTGAVIPGVTVTIVSPALIGGAHTVVTDELGSYRFELLRPGTYRVSFILPGFKTLNVESVEVTANISMTINGNLEVTTTAEEVTVSSTAPAIDLQAATVGVNFSQKMIEDLPWSRSLVGVSQMIPGAYATSYDIGNSSFGNSSAVTARNGGRSGGNVVSYDGLIWCQTYGDYGSFEEMNVSTTSKGADQMNPGITVNMVVKSGGNQFHGNFSGGYENGSMQSNNITSELIAAGYSTGSNKFTHFRNVYGDIGGPILKDRLWFYFAHQDAYNGAFVPGFLTVVGGTPVATFTKIEDPSAKLTYQLTSKQKIDAYWGLDKKWAPYRNAGPLVPLDATQNQDAWSTIGPTLKWTDVIDSKTTASAGILRGGYWWPAYAWPMQQGQGPTLPVVGQLPVINNVGVRVTDTTTKATDGGYLANYTRPIRWQWTADLSRVMTIGGKANELKGGYMGWWDKSYTLTFGYPYSEQYQYTSLKTETCPNNIICSNYFQHPNSVVVYDYPNSNSQGGRYKAAYINDKITVSRKLTLNIGLRYDHASSFLPPQGNPGTGQYAVKNTIPYENSVTNPDGSVATFPIYSLWAPRLSFAYDVMGNGRMAIKASYGRYINMSSSPGSQPGPGAGTSGVDPISAKSCTFNNWTGVIPYIPNFGAQNYLGSPTNVNLSGACSGGASTAIHAFDPNLVSPYLTEYAMGVEFALNRDYSIRVNASRKFDVGGSKTVNVYTPYSAYTDVRCALDPVTGLNDACTYSVPSAFPNRTAVNQLFTNVNLSTHENQAMYTAYDVTFNKQYSNRWSFLAGYGIDLGHPNTSNPLTPDQMLYNSQSDLPTWSQSLKMNGVYELPAIPFVHRWSLPGLLWSSTFTTQSGDWYPLQANVTNALGTSVTQTIIGHYARYPWLTDWDQRISKRFRIRERQSFEIKWDLFNTLNASTVTAYGTNASASTYGHPTTIIVPRIYEWSATYKF